MGCQELPGRHLRTYPFPNSKCANQENCASNRFLYDAKQAPVTCPAISRRNPPPAPATVLVSHSLSPPSLCWVGRGRDHRHLPVERLALFLPEISGSILLFGQTRVFRLSRYSFFGVVTWEGAPTRENLLLRTNQYISVKHTRCPEPPGSGSLPWPSMTTSRWSMRKIAAAQQRNPPHPTQRSPARPSGPAKACGRGRHRPARVPRRSPRPSSRSTSSGSTAWRGGAGTSAVRPRGPTSLAGPVATTTRTTCAAFVKIPLRESRPE